MSPATCKSLSRELELTRSSPGDACSSCAAVTHPERRPRAGRGARLGWFQCCRGEASSQRPPWAPAGVSASEGVPTAGRRMPLVGSTSVCTRFLQPAGRREGTQRSNGRVDDRRHPGRPLLPVSTRKAGQYTSTSTCCVPYRSETKIPNTNAGHRPANVGAMACGRDPASIRSCSASGRVGVSAVPFDGSRTAVCGRRSTILRPEILSSADLRSRRYLLYLQEVSFSTVRDDPVHLTRSNSPVKSVLAPAF